MHYLKQESLTMNAEKDPTKKDLIVAEQTENRPVGKWAAVARDVFDRYTIFIAVIGLCVILGFLSPYFLTYGNIFNLLRISAINGLLTLGMLFVILAGGIDLSVGSIFALTAAIVALALGPSATPHMPVLVAVVLALAAAGATGALNGFIVTHFKVEPFVVTLGMLTVARGATLLLLGGRPAQIGSQDFNNFAQGEVIGIPVPVICYVIALILCGIVLSKTPFGRYVYATGSNFEASYLSGIRTNVIRFFTFVISGLLAGFAGILLASRLFSATPILGQGYELDAIAAVVIGGTSLMGGRGTLSGTVAGVLIISIVNNGLNLLGVSSYYQLLVRGLIVVLAVILDKLWHPNTKMG
jgi:ribose/xylose/arabinose/galactoside ABC-type transport system permease subunit